MNTHRFARLAAFAGLLAFTAPLLAQTPEWIWFNKTTSAEVRFFRKTFSVEGAVTKAELTATADDGLDAFVNGERVLTSDDWHNGVKVDVTAKLHAGANAVALRAHNGDGSPAGAIAQLVVTTAGGKQTIVTDATWKAAVAEAKDWNKADFNDSAWGKANSLGKMGVQPWGNVFGAVAANGGAKAAKAARGGSGRREAPAAENLFTLPDFKVELIHNAESDEGSWVNLCKDNRGRLIISPQFGKASSAEEENRRGLLRVTLAPNGSVAKREWIAQPLYDAQGMVFANGALWVAVNKYSTKFESGLYRVTDDGTDTWRNIELIKKIPGGGEHGPHAVELGPDGNIYVMAGNHTKLVDSIAPTSPHKNFQEDHVLPRQWDGNGHAAGILAPGGQIYRVSQDGKKWEFFCAGFRNEFDMAFNVDGELFTYDSDMEWDWGMPWYRPTRVNHCVSGGEYGWRSGTGKWPDYYPDSLGAIDIGVGCPTGLITGRGAKFPAKYQRALYIMDWTYGRLIAVHLKPDGASYSGTWEKFLCPAGLAEPGKLKPPMNLTDMAIGDDGAMYFVIGGRNTASGLYRISYNGKESTAPANEPNKEGAEARKLRHQLEAFHGRQDAKAVDFLWPHLNSDDRAIRYAARIALEWQPVSQWKDRAIAEKSVNGGLTALLALARNGGKETQADLLNALKKFPFATLPESQQLDKLRVIQLSLVRQGRPAPELAQMGIEKLSPLFPNKSERFNREVVQILIYLNAPDIVSKTLAHMASLATQEDQIHYLFHLRTAKGWTPDQRREYFAHLNGRIAGAQTASISKGHPDFVVRWFEEAGRPYGDGASFANFLKNFRREAIENLSDAEKAELAPLLTATVTSNTGRPAASAFPAAEKRNFVKEWKTADLLPSLDDAGKGRSFQKGMQAFVDAQCILCHRFGNEGGGVGPDLTAVATRFGRRDILESITEPSKVVSEQFLNTTFQLKNGDDVTGRVVEETADKVIIYVNPFTQDRTEIKKADIKSRAPSKLSPMPEGLVNILSKEEILDLIAFLESAGRKTHAAFSKQ